MVCTLDSLDWKLLLELAENCRITYSDLGELFNIPAATVWRRIKKMKVSGMLAGFEIAIGPDYDPSKELTLFLQIENGCSSDELIRQIINHPGTAAVSHIVNSRSILTMEYIDESQIDDYYNFIVNLEGITSVDLYKSKQFPWWDDGPKETVQFSESEIRILKCLLDDPRKSVKDVSDCVKLSLKKVRCIIDDLIRSKKVWFKVRWNPNTELSQCVIMKISLFENHSSRLNILQWISETLEDSFMTEYPIEADNEIFAWFNLEKMSDSIEISKQLQEHPEISAVETLYFPHHIKNLRYGAKLLRTLVDDFNASRFET
jgi:DNA-binding Lrp family transcriptional regulator